jgi:hypothetical protein
VFFQAFLSIIILSPFGKMNEILDPSQCVNGSRNLMMINTLILIALGASLLAIALAGLRRVQNIQTQLNRLSEQLDSTNAVQDLSNHVLELQNTVAGAVTGLNMVSAQMGQLSQMADFSLNDSDEGDIMPHPLLNSIQVLLDFRPEDALRNNIREGHGTPLSVEDMPEALREKIDTFKAIYKTLVHRGHLPSRTSPEEN